MYKTLLMLFLGLATSGLSARDVTDPYDAFRNDNERGEFNYEDSGNQWKEQRVDIKPVDLEKLKKLNIDHGPIGVDLLLDSSSIRSDKKDRVVRYWVVMKNNERISSMLYEGLRCGTGEYKTYANASPRNPDVVRPMGRSSWRQIRGEAHRDYHSELASTYLCAGSITKTVKAIQASLQGRYDFHNPYSEHTDL